MVKYLSKIGNSVGVIIPKPLLTHLGLNAHSRVEVTLEAHAIVVKPVRARRSGKS